MKKVRKILPVSLYDIPGLEKWLEEQANAGLFPVRVDSWVTFTRTGVPGTRFRLEPCNGLSQPDAERLEHYRSAGWEYAFMIGIESLTRGIYFLFYATDPAAVELYTDLQSRGLSLDQLMLQIKKLRRRGWWILAITLAIYAAIIAWVLNLSGQFDVQPDSFSGLPLDIITMAHPFWALYILLAVISSRQNRLGIRALRSMCQALREGIDPPPSPGPRRIVVFERVLSVIMLIPAILLILVKLDIIPLQHIPLEDFWRPYVDIRELDSETAQHWEELFEGSNLWNEPSLYAELEFSLLAPVWYSVTQEAYSPISVSVPNSNSTDQHGGTVRYVPDLDMTYFRLLIPSMARGVAEAQLDAYRLVNLMWSYEDVSYPGLDFVILAKTDSVWQMAALGSGGRVAVFRYAGAEDLAEHLDELAEIVTQ